MASSHHVDMVIGELRAALPLDGHPLDESTVLRSLPDADSVNLLRVAARLERQVDAEFDDEHLFGAETVGDLAGLLDAAAS